MFSFILSWIARLSPWMLIAGLAYAAVFVKPSATGTPLSQPLFERRDMFFSAAGNADSLWFVGQDGAVLHGTSGGTGWLREALPSHANLQAVAVSPQGVVVIASNLGELWVRATGKDWRNLRLPVNESAGKLLDVAFIAGHFWVVGEMGALFRGDPSAGTWVRLGEEQDVAFNAIRSGADGELWIAAEFGRLLRSNDDGATWGVIELGLESLRAVAFEGQVGVAVGNTGEVYLSKSGGDDWQPVAPFTNEHLYDVAVRDGYWSVVGDHGAFFQSRQPDIGWHDSTPAGMGSGYIARVLQIPEGDILVGQQLALIEGGRLTVWPSGEQP